MKIVIVLILIALAGFSVYSSNANAQNLDDMNLKARKGEIQATPVATGFDCTECPNHTSGGTIRTPESYQRFLPSAPNSNSSSPEGTQ